MKIFCEEPDEPLDDQCADARAVVYAGAGGKGQTAALNLDNEDERLRFIGHAVGVSVTPYLKKGRRVQAGSK